MATRVKPLSLHAIFSRPPPPPPPLARHRRKASPPPPASRGRKASNSIPTRISSSSVAAASVDKQIPLSKNSIALLTPSMTTMMMEEKEFSETLSVEGVKLLKRFNDEGYFRNARFYREGEFDIQNLPRNRYSVNLIISSAEDFGFKHQEIAKWLSGSHLKKLAVFGCPSTERSTVFAAKRLRSYFKSHENNACRACLLKSSCNFVNKEVGRVENVILADVMRLLTSYTLDSVPPELSAPNDLKLSVNKLLKEVINLSE